MVNHNPLRNVSPVDYQGFNPADRIPVEFKTPQPTLIDRFGLFTHLATIELAPSILIVDLSHWNGNINWDALWASGVRVVILKCSEAAENTYYEYKDVKFEENWRAALDRGFVVMLYHFFRGEKGSAERSWFMKCADAFLSDPRINGKTAAWLDCEWKPQAQTLVAYANRAFGFCSLIKGDGMRQGIYSSPGLVPQLFPAGETRWDNVFQWNAHWTSWPEDTLPAGWSEGLRKVWQFGIYPTHSWTPVVNGAGTVDVNHGYWASVQHLQEWLRLAVASPSASQSWSPSASPSPSPVPDCCEEHALRLDTIEAGMQVLTEVQQSQQRQIAEDGVLIARNMDEIIANKAAIATLTASLQEHDLRIAMNEARSLRHQDINNKLHQAFHLDPDE